MIPLKFVTPLPALLTLAKAALDANEYSAAEVKRRLPDPRPLQLVILRDDGGSRAAEVHKVCRIVGLAYADFAIGGEVDFDSINAIASITMAALEAAPQTVPELSAVLDSRGHFEVKDEALGEYRMFSIEYQIRGVRL